MIYHKEPTVLELMFLGGFLVLLLGIFCVEVLQFKPLLWGIALLAFAGWVWQLVKRG